MRQNDQNTQIVEETREILDLATLLIGKANDLLDLHALTMGAGDAASVQHLNARQPGAAAAVLPFRPVRVERRCRSALSDASVRCAHARFNAWVRFRHLAEPRELRAAS